MAYIKVEVGTTDGWFSFSQRPHSLPTQPTPAPNPYTLFLTTYDFQRPRSLHPISRILLTPPEEDARTHHVPLYTPPSSASRAPRFGAHGSSDGARPRPHADHGRPAESRVRASKERCRCIQSYDEENSATGDGNDEWGEDEKGNGTEEAALEETRCVGRGLI